MAGFLDINGSASHSLSLATQSQSGADSGIYGATSNSLGDFHFGNVNIAKNGSAGSSSEILILLAVAAAVAWFFYKK